MKEKINRNDLINELNKYIYDFRIFRTKRSFGDSVFAGKITISGADKKQSNLLEVILNFNNKVRQGSKADKEKKSNTYESANSL